MLQQDKALFVVWFFAFFAVCGCSSILFGQVNPQPAWMAPPGAAPTITNYQIHYPSGGFTCVTCTTSTSPRCLVAPVSAVSCGHSGTITYTSGTTWSIGLSVTCGAASVTGGYEYSESTSWTEIISSGPCQTCRLVICYPEVAVTVRRCERRSPSGRIEVTHTTRIRPSGQPTRTTSCESTPDFCCNLGHLSCCDGPTGPGVSEPPQSHPGVIRNGNSFFDSVETIDISGYLSEKRPTVLSLTDLSLIELGSLYIQVYGMMSMPVPVGEIHGVSISCAGVLVVPILIHEELLEEIEQVGADLIAANLHLDVNFDGVVDALDIIEVYSATVQLPADAAIAKSTDTNGDGFLDIQDLAAFAGQ